MMQSIQSCSNASQCHCNQHDAVTVEDLVQPWRDYDLKGAATYTFVWRGTCDST